MTSSKTTKTSQTPRVEGMWRMPSRREFKPKPMDAGQVVTWMVRIEGHYERPGYMDGDTYCGPSGRWFEAVEYVRTGVIWSVATSASAWWVVPDDDPASPVVVRRAGKSQHRHAEGTLFESGECSGWRDGIRRAENVRRRGVFPVVESEYTSRSWSGPGTTWKNVIWHADPDCPLAAGKERYDGTGCAHGTTGPDYAMWTAASIADVMVGRVRLNSDGPFCKHCVLLEAADVQARELASA